MTIAETARKYGLTPDTLRYYERIGLIPGVNRTQGGVRDYTEEDRRWVEFAKCMRGAGLSVESLIGYVALFQQGDATRDCRKQLLIDQRDQLAPGCAADAGQAQRQDRALRPDHRPGGGRAEQIDRQRYQGVSLYYVHGGRDKQNP